MTTNIDEHTRSRIAAVALAKGDPVRNRPDDPDANQQSR